MLLVRLLKRAFSPPWLGVTALLITLVAGIGMQALQRAQQEHHAKQVLEAPPSGTQRPQPCNILHLEFAAFSSDLKTSLGACQEAPGSAAIVLIDFGFAFGYALLLFSLGWACAGRCANVPAADAWYVLVLLAAFGQLAAGLADWLENIGLLLLLSYGPSAILTWFTTIFAVLKFSLLAIGLLIFLLASIWNGAVRYAWHVMSATWLTAVLALAGPLLLAFFDQGQDLLRDLVERPREQVAIFLGACLLFATSVWYWTQKSIQVSENDYTAANAATHPEYIDEWYPRLLGGATLLLTALALHQTSVEFAKFAASESQAIKALSVEVAAQKSEAIKVLAGSADTAQNLALGLVLATALFVLVVWQRRPALRLAGSAVRAVATFAGRKVGRAVATSDSYRPGSLAWFFRHQKAAIFILGIFTLAAGAISLFVVPRFGLALAPTLGTATVVYVWASLVIPLAAAICIASVRTGLPILILVLAYAVAVSFFNDNHAVRHVALPADAPKKSDQTFDRYFDAWLGKLVAQRQLQSSPSIPVFLVSAEGGGIRAAYWSALVLAHLRDQHGEAFSQHIFAMSGVSGGSLGVGAFATLLAGARPVDCLGGGTPLKKPYDSLYAQDAHCALDRDFLAAPVAAMLFSDLTQRLLPFPVEAFDRARFLEQGFERAFAEPNAMQQGFGALWAPGRSQVPLLLLNTTQVQTGGRGVAAYPRFAKDALLRDVIGEYRGTETLPLSAAVGLSARFPLLSPPGVLHTQDDTPWFVDGGYFDNSGAVTLREMLRIVHAAKVRHPKLVPVILHIVNDAGQRSRCSDTPSRPARDTLSFAQVFAPLEAVMNAREARNPVARAILAEELLQGPGDPCAAEFLQFHLRAAQVSAPLGWTMSRGVEEAIFAQLESEEMQKLSKRIGDLLKAKAQ